MGQTLTHGIYLPDEGERNCYAGLAANWNILDGAVGTVADHTTALAGKAPLVHTHTKSDITDFPVYGTTAGTICEGNDSRLSDARTPVAHTHTKSDVTDLLNSNFIPSANNTYNLGSSSYQWNNIYSKGYYYNGTAWGLDKANTWTGTNTFTSSMYCNDAAFVYNASTIEQGTAPASLKYYGARRVYDKNSNQVFQERGYIGTTKDNCYRWILTTWDSSSYKGFEIITSSDGTNVRFTPYSNGDTDLGTSDKKWKTFNGINPGALSFPDLSSGTGVSLSAGANSYSPPSSGWLSINLTGAISVVCGDFCHSGTDMISVPVVKGSTYTVTVATSGTAYLFVSQGNV